MPPTTNERQQPPPARTGTSSRTADIEETETRRSDDRERERERDQNACPECDGTLRKQDGGTYCVDCGLVIDEDHIDHGPEWRAFTTAERNEKSRVGAPTTEMLHDRGLSTTIDWRNKDAYGVSLSAERRKQFQRLRIWDKRYRTRNASERNLKHALGEIDRMSSALGVPDSVAETASVIYRRALDEDLLPGRSIEGMATASLYASIRQAGVPRSATELTTVSRIDYLEATRSYRYLIRELELPMAPPDPLEYIPRYASQLAISNETERRAYDLLKRGIEASVHSGKDPTGLAAAALYAGAQLTDEKLTQEAVSEAAEISKVTIRNRYRELLELEVAAGSGKQ